MDTFKVGQRGPVFFLHIPKTAGMSLRAYLRNQYQPTDVFPPETWPDVVRTGMQPFSYRLVQGHFFYNMRWALQPGTPMVAVLREPLTRTLSGLRHLQRDMHFHRQHALVAGRDIRQLLRDPVIMGAQANIQAAALCASASPDEVVRHLARTLPTHPGAEASDLESPPTLELALQRLDEVEFLGTMDNLPTLLSCLAEAMGYHPMLRLSLINEAPDAATVLDELEPDDIEILREHNKIDLELYQRAVELATLRGMKRALISLAVSGTYTCPAGAFALDLGGPIPGFGWYEAEWSGDAVWRWTGPEERFTIEICLPPGVSYTAEICFNMIDGSLPTNMSLRMNGVSVPLAVEREADSFLARWQMPASLTKRHEGCCQLAFNTGPTRRSGNDMRRLGVAVRRLAFAPK